MSRNFVGSFEHFLVLFLFGFAFAKVNWPFDQSFNMTLPQEKSFERYEELLVGGPKHPQHRIPSARTWDAQTLIIGPAVYGDLTEELNAQFKTFHDVSMFAPFRCWSCTQRS